MPGVEDAAIRIAVLARAQEHPSLLRYRDAMFDRLPRRGVELLSFEPGAPVPSGVELVWDPALGMRSVPAVLDKTRLPVVATVLGLRALAVPIEAVRATPAERETESQLIQEVMAGWARLRPNLAAAIAISHDCADTVVSRLGIDHRRVHVAHLAVERRVFHPSPQRQVIPRDYWLHVSLGEPARKNLPRLLAAYQQIPENERIALVIKTGQAFGMPELPSGVRLLTGQCPDTELAELYRGARGLLFPSIYEGFGLPILEAMSCGCPVITSNTSACAEVAGGAALEVDPTSVPDLVAAMRRLLRDDALALRLSREGRRRAAAFDWEICADQHARILQSAAPGIKNGSKVVA